MGLGQPLLVAGHCDPPSEDQVFLSQASRKTNDDRYPQPGMDEAHLALAQQYTIANEPALNVSYLIRLVDGILARE
jgi:hypothetical protein